MKKINVRRALLAVLAAGVILVTSGCANTTGANNESRIPKNYGVPSEYNKFSDYYTMGIRNGEKTKLFKRDYIWILFDKETLEGHKYIYKDESEYFRHIEMYDLETGEMLFYGRSAGLILPGDHYNADYASYLIDHGYDLGFKDLDKYIEGVEKKDYYSIEEIDEIIPQLREACITLNNIPRK